MELVGVRGGYAKTLGSVASISRDFAKASLTLSSDAQRFLSQSRREEVLREIAKMNWDRRGERQESSS